MPSKGVKRARITAQALMMQLCYRCDVSSVRYYGRQHTVVNLVKPKELYVWSHELFPNRSESHLSGPALARLHLLLCITYMAYAFRNVF